MVTFGKITAVVLLGLSLGMILAMGVIGPVCDVDASCDEEDGWCNSHCPKSISEYEKCRAQCRYKSGHSGSHTCLRWHNF